MTRLTERSLMSSISEKTLKTHELEQMLLNSDFDFTQLPEYVEGTGWAVDEAVDIYSDYPATASLFTVLNDQRFSDSREGDTWRGLVVRTIAHLHHLLYTAPADQVNHLVIPASSAGWEARYNHQVARTVIRKGTIMDLNPSPYGWGDYSFFHDNPGVEVSRVTHISEDDWSEFTDTYAEETSRIAHGYTATVLLSNNMERKMRWEPTLSEALTSLLNEKP